MGENEQGGMLRTVVVLGLIALIVASVIATIMGLKGRMSESSNKMQAQIEKAITFGEKNNFVDQNPTDNAVDTSNAKLGDQSSWRLSSDGPLGKAMTVGQDDQDQQAFEMHGYAVLYSPQLDIPDDTRNMHVHFRVKTAKNVYVYASTDGSAKSAGRYSSWWGSKPFYTYKDQDNEWQDVNLDISLDEADGTQSKNRKVTFKICNSSYNPSDDVTDAVSQWNVSFT